MKTKQQLLAELEKAHQRIAELEAQCRAGAQPVSGQAGCGPERAGLSLEREQEFTSILLDNLGEGVVACDAQGKLILFNRTAREWHGLEAAPLGQQDWASHYGLYEVDGTTPLPADRIALARALMGEQVRDAAMIIRAQGRPLRHVLVNGAPFRDARGNMLGAVVVMHDITRRRAMEQDLESSRAQLALAMDMALLARWERDLATGVYTFNEQFYALYGTTAEREGGMRMSGEAYRDAFVHPDDREAVAEIAERYSDAGQDNPASFEHRIVLRGGEVRHMSVRFFTLKDAGGRPVKRIGATQDITGRKKLEQDLAFSRAQLALAMEMASLVRWEYDLSSGMFTFDDQFYALYGTTAEREGGYKMSSETYKREFVHPDDWQIYNDTTSRTHADGAARILRAEHKIIRRNGEVRHISVRFLLPDESGAGTVVGANQDITELKRAEQALLESQDNLRRFTELVAETLRKTRTVLDNILESMPSAIIALDTRGLVTHWNKCASDLSGRSAVEALGKPLAEVFPALAPRMADVKLAMQSARQQSKEKMPFLMGSEPRIMDIMIYPLLADGVEGAVLRLDDVTRRVQMEEMMVQTEKMMTVGSLAGGMAHEINNPLAGILHSAQNIRRRLSPDLPANVRAARQAGCSMESIQAYMEGREILSFLEAIAQSGERAGSIVRNMLGFIRKSPSAHAPASLPDLVDRALELASTDYDLKKKFDFKRIEVAREYQDDMPPVACAAMEIEQVVFNILVNAAHALDAKRRQDHAPRIVLRVLREGSMGVIQIEDNGHGMDEQVRKNIFEPFFTTKQTGEGTGLGLSVSYFIVTRNHDGAISADSFPGKGTVFTIRLPIRSGRVAKKN